MSSLRDGRPARAARAGRDHGQRHAEVDQHHVTAARRRHEIHGDLGEVAERILDDGCPLASRHDSHRHHALITPDAPAHRRCITRWRDLALRCCGADTDELVHFHAVLEGRDCAR